MLQSGKNEFRISPGRLAVIIVFSFLVFALPHAASASFYVPEYPIKASDFSLVRKDGIFHIFYTVNCFEANPICDDTTVGHATSPDLTNWTRQANILENGSGFDADEMWAPDVVEVNGTYYLFYAGVDWNGTAYVQKIGLARSNDLYTWEKDPRSPIVNCDDFSWAYWDEGTAWRAECRDPSVFWDAPLSRWIMTVSGRPVATPTRMIIGLASSTDLVTWTELGTVPLTETASAKAESSSMLYRDGQYLLHWTTATGAVYSTSTSPTSGFATLGSFDDGLGFATEIRQIDGLTVYAEAYNPELHFQELTWGSGVSFTIGELPFGSVSGMVYRDADGDGAFDLGESGIGGVAVQLVVDDGDGAYEPTNADFFRLTATTSSSGGYSFPTTLPESYWVLVPASNEGSGQPLRGLLRTSGVASGSLFGNPRFQAVARSGSYASLDFGFIAPGRIEGTVWSDVDRDGVEDAGEGGFSGVTVNLNGTETTGRTAFRQTATDSTGTFAFPALFPGTYTATVSDLAGILGQYTLTSGNKEDATVDTANIALADGETHQTADFGYAGIVAATTGGSIVQKNRPEAVPIGDSKEAAQILRDATANQPSVPTLPVRIAEGRGGAPPAPAGGVRSDAFPPVPDAVPKVAGAVDSFSVSPFPAQGRPSALRIAGDETAATQAALPWFIALMPPFATLFCFNVVERRRQPRAIATPADFPP